MAAPDKNSARRPGSRSRSSVTLRFPGIDVAEQCAGIRPGMAGPERPLLPQRITAGPLDLDDIRPEISEQPVP